MKKFILLLLLLSASVPMLAQEGARDAIAVLNRCGKPLKGDDTVFTNADSHRTLLYERGTLLFERVGDNGWKFVSGSHKKQKDLTADQMAVFMGPCLKLALADSAAPEPIKTVTSVQRMETSAKHSIKKVILYALLGLVVLGGIFFLISRHKPSDPDDE